MRNDVENIIKEFHLDRKRIFEVSKFKYASIIHQIEKTFVKNGQHIHWSNMGNGFQSQWSCVYKDISQQMNWYHLLPQIILDNKEPIYVLFEDTVNYQPKYWLYEMYIPELIVVIDQRKKLKINKSFHDNPPVFERQPIVSKSHLLKKKSYKVLISPFLQTS